MEMYHATNERNISDYLPLETVIAKLKLRVNLLDTYEISQTLMGSQIVYYIP